MANHRLIRDPANAALQQALSALVNSAPNSDQRAQLAKPGYDQLKAPLMMARPIKPMAHFCADHENGPADANGDLDRSVAKSGAGFVGLYLSLLPERPEWKIIPMRNG